MNALLVFLRSLSFAPFYQGLKRMLIGLSSRNVDPDFANLGQTDVWNLLPLKDFQILSHPVRSSTLYRQTGEFIPPGPSLEEITLKGGPQNIISLGAFTKMLSPSPDGGKLIVHDFASGRQEDRSRNIDSICWYLSPEHPICSGLKHLDITIDSDRPYETFAVIAEEAQDLESLVLKFTPLFFAKLEPGNINHIGWLDFPLSKLPNLKELWMPWPYVLEIPENNSNDDDSDEYEYTTDAIPLSYQHRIRRATGIREIDMCRIESWIFYLIGERHLQLEIIGITAVKVFPPESGSMPLRRSTLVELCSPITMAPGGVVSSPDSSSTCADDDGTTVYFGWEVREIDTD
ncbi:hypothetical protein TWF481_004538 [Arthrobotrys musiformis]|uniref:Uncharacterized protein n=1 Tax=Arthrobotrys musiformis TaxID=47236 RepID=A0AAV9WJT6_9PEZI